MAGFETKEKKPGPGKGHSAELVPAFTEIVVRRCKVCASPFRREVDSLLLSGWSQAAVMRHYNQIIDDPLAKFKPQNMSVHARKHLSAGNAAIRRILEARAIQAGIDVDQAQDTILTKLGVLDTIVHSGLISLQTGNKEAEARDVIQAIGMMEKMEASMNAVAIDEIMGEFKIFMAAVKKAVGEDKYDEIFQNFVQMLEGRNSQVIGRPIDEETIKGLPEYSSIVGEEEEAEDAEFEEVGQ